MTTRATHPLSPNTARSYSTAWKFFTTWCEKNGRQSLPADPETVAAYLTDRAEERASLSTLKVARAAIRRMHETAGHASATQASAVGQVLRDVGTVIPAREQVKGLSADDLAKIKATAKRPRQFKNGRCESEKAARWRGAVDIALISVMRDALLRRSEAAALQWADIEFADDGSGLVTIRRSGTGQEGTGIVLFIGNDAASALRAIRPADDATDIASRSAFGLASGQAIARRIQAAAAAAGLPGNYSGHSPRLGMALDLAEAGASTTDLMVAGRWQVHHMPSALIKGVESRRGFLDPRQSVVAKYYASG